MILYGPLETDARVQRTLGVLRRLKREIHITTCNTRPGYSVDGVQIQNITFRKFGIKGYMNFCYKSLKSFWKDRHEINLIYLNDFYSVIPGLLISLIFPKYPILYDAHELILSDKDYKESKKNRFFAWFERILVGRVKKVVEANKERMDLIVSRYSLTNADYVLNISKMNFSSCHRKISKDGTIRIVYQGVLAKSRNLAFFLKCIKQLPDCFELIYIGDGDALNELKEEAKLLGIEKRVSFTGRLTNKDMLHYLSTCHVGIISYPFINFNNIYCSPNKIFEYAAMSLPFISTNQPFIVGVQERYSIGRTFNFNDVDSFIHEITILVNDYDSYRKGFEIFLNDYNYEKEMAKLERIIEEATNKDYGHSR